MGGGNPSSPPSRLVPLVQGLSHQVHLFQVEYNKCSRLGLDLPGYRPGGRGREERRDTTGGDERSARRQASEEDHQLVPEEILHQQRTLLQCCDRLKLAASLHQSGSRSTMGEAVDVVTHLGAAFTRLIELMLSKEIKVG